MYKYQSLNWRPQEERVKEKRHLSCPNAAYKYESLNWRPVAEREEEARQVASNRNWQKLTPGAEGTALGGLLTVGIICLNISLALMTVICTSDEKNITEAAVVLHLPAPMFLATKTAVQQEIVRIKHQYATIASNRIDQVQHNSNAAPVEQHANVNKAESGTLTAAAPISQMQEITKPGNSIAGNNAVSKPTEIAAVQTPLPIPVQGQVDKVDTNQSLAKIEADREIKKGSLVFNEDEHRITAPNLLVKLSNDASLHFDKAGLLVLKVGDAVVDTSKPFLIKAGDARVLLKSSSTVLVSLRDGVLKIRNLQEKKAYTAQVLFADHNFPLCAGQELVAAQSFDHLGLAVSGDNVKRRQIRTFDLEDGTNIMCSEFNAANVIKSTPVLKQMMLASACQEESKTSWKVMKMAAALDIVTRGHGEYFPVSNSQGAQIASSDPAGDHTSSSN